MFEPDAIAALAVAAHGKDDRTLFERLSALPVPVYTTDADGWIGFFNPACDEFAGKATTPGEDRWCVSWKLRTCGGQPLAHEACPMAECVRKGEAIRGVRAIAERPDGKLYAFTPYPTPVFGNDGVFRGAINLFADVHEEAEASRLNCEAQRYRRLARAMGDRETVARLMAIADEYEAEILQALTRH